MKILVIGGSGLIGSKLVERLTANGHDVVAASPATGVDTLRGTGLTESVRGAEVVVDVSNSPSFEDGAVMDFFVRSTTNLLAAEAAAGVRHHVALSVVGTDRLQASGYFRAKQAQEDLIRSSGIPYTIVHSTQFFEFVPGIANAGTVGTTVHVSSAPIRPIGSDDVAAAMSEIVAGSPVAGIVEIAGPERMQLSELVRRFLSDTEDPRSVAEDARARYFGAELDETSLVPGPDARLATTTYRTWWAARSAR